MTPFQALSIVEGWGDCNDGETLFTAWQELIDTGFAFAINTEDFEGDQISLKAIKLIHLGMVLMPEYRSVPTLN